MAIKSLIHRPVNKINIHKLLKETAEPQSKAHQQVWVWVGKKKKIYKHLYFFE